MCFMLLEFLVNYAQHVLEFLVNYAQHVLEFLVNYAQHVQGNVCRCSCKKSVHYYVILTETEFID